MPILIDYVSELPGNISPGTFCGKWEDCPVFDDPYLKEGRIVLIKNPWCIHKHPEVTLEQVRERFQRFLEAMKAPI